MASEQAIIGISMLALGFLWYSNELAKRGSMLWGQAFQMISFMFMLVDFTVMREIFRSESLFDMEDLVFEGLWNVVWWLMWLLLGLWIFSMAFNMLASLRKPKETERAERIGRNSYGAQ